MSAHSSVPLAAESDGRRSSLVIEGVDEVRALHSPDVLLNRILELWRRSTRDRSTRKRFHER